MPKKITALVRLRINVTAFSNAFHASKPRDERRVLPLRVTVYEDTSFSPVIETAREAVRGVPVVVV